MKRYVHDLTVGWILGFTYVCTGLQAACASVAEGHA